MNGHHGLVSGQYLRAMAISGGNASGAAAYAQGQNWSARDEISMSLSAMATKSATPAVGLNSGMGQTPVGRDFLETLRPLEIFGRLTRVSIRPLLTRILTQNGTSAAVVAEGAPVPISLGAFTATVLQPQKIVGMLVATDDLIRMAEPDADRSLSSDLAAAVALAADKALVDPGVIGSVLNAAPAVASTGSTVANIDADLEATIDALLATGSNLSAAVWVLSPKTATHLAILRSSGLPAYPSVSASGGQLAGLPVLVSGAVNGYIGLLDQSGIVVGEDEDVALDQTNQASLQLLDNPTNNSLGPTPTNLVSMFQANSVALRAMLWRGWYGRPGCGAVLTGVTY